MRPGGGQRLERVWLQPDEDDLVGRGAGEPLGEDGEHPAHLEVVDGDLPAVDGDQLGALLPVGLEQGGRPGLGPSDRSRGKRRTIPMAVEPRANRPPSSLRRLTTMPPRSVIGRGHGLALGLGGVELVPLLDEGALGHQVLAPGGDPEAQGQQADAEGDGLPLGAGRHPVGHAEADEAEEPDDHGDGRHRLGPLGVLGVGLQVGVVEGGRRQRPFEAGGLVAHVRSPIQKQTSISTPTPSSRPTKPSPTGPIPPRPNPPGLAGCWMTPVHVGGDVPGLGVGDVARAEVGHVARARSGWPRRSGWGWPGGGWGRRPRPSARHRRR